MKFVLLILHSVLVIINAINTVSYWQHANKAVPVIWMITTLCWLILVVWDVCNISK